MISSKRGKLYFKFVLAAAIIAATIYSYTSLVAVPAATQTIANNATTITGVPIANAALEGDMT